MTTMLEVDRGNWRKMKQTICAYLLFCLLTATFITSVNASVTLQAIIDRDIHVSFDLEITNSTIYSTTKNLVTELTFPNSILEYFNQRNVTNVDVYNQAIDFDDSTSSMYITFSLTGSDIMNFTVDTRSMTKTYHVRTDWRKFQINLTNGFLLNFAEYFSEPMETWQRINHTLNTKTHLAFYNDFIDSSTIDLECYFILPATASNTQVTGDILIFEVPLTLPFADSFLNSPFLILSALLVVNVVFFIYRRVKK